VTAAGSVGDAYSERSFVSSRSVPCNRTKKLPRFHILPFRKWMNLRNPRISQAPT
jgi:hypothetical protein